MVFITHENIASYLNGKLDVTVPDLICMIDKDGNPMTTPDFQVGDEMNVFVLPAPEIWKCDEGLAVLGPKHFGVDTDYIPFAEREKCS